MKGPATIAGSTRKRRQTIGIVVPRTEDQVTAITMAVPIAAPNARLPSMSDSSMLATTAVKLLWRAQRLAADSQDGENFITRLSAVSHACEVFLGATVGDTVDDGLPREVSVAAATADPVLGALATAAEALASAGETERADEAFQLALTRVERARKIVSRGRNAEQMEGVRCLAVLVLKTQSAVAYRQAEQLARGFHRHVEIAERTPMPDRRRERELALRELAQAVEIMGRVAQQYDHHGFAFENTEYDRIARQWGETLRGRSEEWGLT